MIRAVSTAHALRPFGQVATTTTTVGPTTTSTLAPTTTTSTTAAPTTTVARTTTTLAHAATRATTTTVAPANSSASDRGVVHQAFIDMGASHASAHTAQIYLDAPIKVVFVLLVALVLTRLVSRISHRMVNGMRLVSPLVQATPRGTARVQTLGGAFTSVFRAIIWVVAFLEILSLFAINLAPFVATATVVGAALGFGAQTLVKDFLSGILILAEDQYGVGDHIAIGTGATITSGTVESVNLRVTRLRGADGGILYVPNGDIRTLSNDTETDSAALVDVVVPAGTDLVAAGVAAQEAARSLAADPDWSNEFVSEPYFAGVQESTVDGVKLRVIGLTRPGQHLRVAREMRLRIHERLRRDRLAWAPPDEGPPAVPTESEVRKARAEKRQAERAQAEKVTPPVTAVRKRRRAAAEAAGAQPGTGQPGSGQPGSGQPGSGQPGSGQQGSGQPGSGQPESTGGRSDPATDPDVTTED